MVMSGQILGCKECGTHASVKNKKQDGGTQWNLMCPIEACSSGQMSQAGKGEADAVQEPNTSRRKNKIALAAIFPTLITVWLTVLPR